MNAATHAPETVQSPAASLTELGKSACLGLGRWHWWWLRQFAAAKLSHGEYRMGVGDWGGTVQGRALAGLMKRDLVGLSMAFGEIGLLALTPEGVAALRPYLERSGPETLRLKSTSARKSSSSCATHKGRVLLSANAQGDSVG